jgi:Na+-driven multidrug efflux pump
VFPLFLALQTARDRLRALGARDPERAQSVSGVGVAIALLGTLPTTTLLLVDGPMLYAAMGLQGAALTMAILYGGVMFGGSLFVWSMNILANV